MTTSALLSAWLVGAPICAASPSPKTTRLQQHLDDLAGHPTELLARGRVNVLLFVAPDKEFSVPAIKALTACRAKLQGAAVRWTGVTGGRYEVTAARQMLRDAEADLDVLVDDADAVAATLRVVVRPTAVVIDGGGQPVQRQPFLKVGFGDHLCARVSHTLGRIDDAQLERALNPPQKAPINRARRHAASQVKMARALLRMKHLDHADKAARKAIAAAPGYAPGHTALGQVLAARGDCPGALEALATALELDPEDQAAKHARARCQPPKPPSPVPVKPTENPGDSPP